MDIERAVFGQKIKGLNYSVRIGVYAISFDRGKEKVLTVQNGRGDYFLPGGGLKQNESHMEGLKRELTEETGFEIKTERYIGKAEQYFLSSKHEPILSEGHFYVVSLIEKTQEPVEDDYRLQWVRIEKINELLLHKYQIWAVHQAIQS